MDDCIFKVESKFTSEANIAFQRYHSRKIMLLFYLVCPIVFVALGVMTILGEERDLISGITLIVCGVLLPFLLYFIYNSQIKKNKQAFMGNDTLSVIEFSDEGVVERTFRGEEQVGVTSVKYSDLFKVCEDKKYYYVYISKIQAFIIDKNGFTVGEESKFGEFMALKNVVYKPLKRKTAK